MSLLDTKQELYAGGSKFTYSLANRILDYVMMGRTLKNIAKMNGYPGLPTMHSWIAKGDIPVSEVTPTNQHYFQFYHAYIAAQRVSAERIYEEWVLTEKKLLTKKLDYKIAKVAIDSLKARAALMNPDRFSSTKVVKKKVENPQREPRDRFQRKVMGRDGQGPMKNVTRKPAQLPEKLPEDNDGHSASMVH